MQKTVGLHAQDGFIRSFLIDAQLHTSEKSSYGQLFDAAVSAVSGRQAVTNAIAEDAPFSPSLIIAVGKAAVPSDSRGPG